MGFLSASDPAVHLSSHNGVLQRLPMSPIQAASWIFSTISALELSASPKREETERRLYTLPMRYQGRAIEQSGFAAQVNTL